MDNLKEIKITDSYLGLDQDVRKCQNVESLFSCTTRQYTETIMQECGCLPLNIYLSKQVKKVWIFWFRSCHILQVPLCSPKDLKCVDRISLNDATCIKPCSGLIVSSLSKTELKQNVEDLLYFAEDYNTYKIITPSPYFGSNGKLLILNLFYFIKVF